MCIVTAWQPFISKRRDTLAGIVHGLWTAWNSRSVNLTTHLHVRPELRTVELYLCSSYMPSSQAQGYLYLYLYRYVSFCNVQHSTITSTDSQRLLQFEGHETPITLRGPNSDHAVSLDQSVIRYASHYEFFYIISYVSACFVAWNISSWWMSETGM